MRYVRDALVEAVAALLAHDAGDGAAQHDEDDEDYDRDYDLAARGEPDDY